MTSTLKKIPAPRPGIMSSDQSGRDLGFGFSEVRSGEITLDTPNQPLDIAGTSGSINDVILSLGACGADVDDTLALTADVKINGVSCLTTQPIISSTAGSSSEQKTTATSGTGITQAVINSSANTFEKGDIITADYVVTRVTPQTEMSQPAVVALIDPVMQN